MRLYNNIEGQYPGLDLSPIKMGYKFWRDGEDRQQLPDRDYFIDQCRGDGPLCINIEHWKWDIRVNPTSVVDDSIRKLITLTQWATEAFPGRVIGHYSLFPLRDYWTPQMSKVLHPLRWRELRHANGYMKKVRQANGRYNSVGLADVSHVTMPSLYAFYEDREGWVKYAIANIKEAEGYGKPVVPFLWPRYHGSNAKLGLTSIPADYWMLMLDTLKEAGIREAVIWDNDFYFRNPKRGGEAWTEQTPWIQATREWMAKQ